MQCPKVPQANWPQTPLLLRFWPLGLVLNAHFSQGKSFLFSLSLSSPCDLYTRAKNEGESETDLDTQPNQVLKAKVKTEREIHSHAHLVIYWLF